MNDNEHDARILYGAAEIIRRRSNNGTVARVLAVTLEKMAAKLLMETTR
jgi:hypothetical protein